MTQQTLWRFSYKREEVLLVFSVYFKEQMDDLPQFVTKCDPKQARKRKSDRSTWKRTAEQKKRYVKFCIKLHFKVKGMVLCIMLSKYF